MDKVEMERLLEKYQRGLCSDSEKKLVEDFLQSYQKNNEWIDWKHGDEDQTGERIYMKVRAAIEEKQEPGIFQRSLRYAAIVAVVAAAAVLGYLQFYQSSEIPAIRMITKTTQRGQKANIVLADGTTIRLNSESSLTYPESFTNETRGVKLTGEAFFDVARNEQKPFIVESGEINTTVLGTSFNIKAFPDKNIEVTVATGKVHVETAFSPHSKGGDAEGRAGSRVLLTPNQQAVYEPSGSLQKREVDLSKYLAWQEGRIIFDEIPLGEAILILERWYNVSFVLETKLIGNCIIRNEYNDENLLNILESFKHILGVEYRFDNESNSIILFGKGCDQSPSHSGGEPNHKPN
ncbi:FecR family protein [Marinoscillum sp.]|uniref:FecR family protein n=1 Tax=Marinoscillum sp. TaxID=2024838 RepID=UPI003BAD881D